MLQTAGMVERELWSEIFRRRFPATGRVGRTRARLLSWCIAALVLGAIGGVRTGNAALPKRLVLLLDGVAYRDVKALQAGLTYLDPHGRQFTRRGFHEGYFPASRLISTFPSASDVAWTEIFGNRPTPGYQRTYFCQATAGAVFRNGVTTSMEYELQMNWQLESNVRRAFGYLHPQWTFEYEARNLLKNFLQATNGIETFYGMMRASDDAQHTSGDIFALMCFLEAELQKVCATYRAREGRDLEILILSDHGNNHAGPGKRVAVRSFLRAAGYRVADHIQNPKDVVLPTVGIQNWVELHCAPAEIAKLVELLPDLEGVDCFTAQVAGRPHEFLVVNSRRERARIEWNPSTKSYRYAPERGDPLGYQPVLASLAEKNRMDAHGFAAADEWLRETMTHRYPLAPERIVRGHTALSLNPASILISLAPGYVHSSWLLSQLSSIIRLGGTHGSLDDLSSNGVLLSNFAPTIDTSTTRVAALYDGFRGLRNPRGSQRGAEWIYGDVQAKAAVARNAVDEFCSAFPGETPLLRVWTPGFTDANDAATLEVTLAPAGRMLRPHLRRGDPLPADDGEQRFTLSHSLVDRHRSDGERVYELPEGLVLEPQKDYRIRGRINSPERNTPVFEFTFPTDRRGRPVVR